MSKDLPYYKVACVVESHYFSYQSYVNVRDAHTISLREQCQFIVIKPPKGIKKPCGFGWQYFWKETVLYKPEELVEPTCAHLWNKGFEIQLNLHSVVSYETHCYTYIAVLSVSFSWAVVRYFRCMPPLNPIVGETHSFVMLPSLSQKKMKHCTMNLQVGNSVEWLNVTGT